MMSRAKRWLAGGTVAGFSLAVACGDDNEGGPGGSGGAGNVSPEQTGDQCEVDDDCFPDVDPT